MCTLSSILGISLETSKTVHHVIVPVLDLNDLANVNEKNTEREKLVRRGSTFPSRCEARKGAFEWRLDEWASAAPRGAWAETLFGSASSGWQSDLSRPMRKEG
ncbi:hypothetical protein TNIN_488151 [Trichonephila inaurata madagascariensis]|uniref:Uncharacterized protein n=1 Tax=Trichonephila inaurata madagascariensis TaxID=2747483 RepID=A0A8X6YEI0_9ARAC|nr:hypothetical protein TNIN_488151 [Trichonephila inaurata madagascariensis]